MEPSGEGLGEINIMFVPGPEKRSLGPDKRDKKGKSGYPVLLFTVLSIFVGNTLDQGSNSKQVYLRSYSAQFSNFRAVFIGLAQLSHSRTSIKILC